MSERYVTGWEKIVGFDPVIEGLRGGDRKDRQLGLIPLKASHSEIPGCEPDWDLRTPRPGWRRIPGCIRVVKASIPNPIPYEAPPWAGWRGVVTKDGLVFDFESGQPMKDYNHQPVGAAPVVGAPPGFYAKKLKGEK